MKQPYNSGFAKATLMIIIAARIMTSSSTAQNIFLKTYGGSKNEIMNTMVRSHDGGFIMAGSTESYGQGNFGNTDDYVIKTDSEGNVLWSKSLGLQSYDDIYWIEPTNDSGYAICGIASDNNTSIGILLAKISESGDIVWQKVLEQDHVGIGYCIRQTTDGGFIAAAEILTNDNIDFLLIKLDGNGNVTWSKQMGSAEPDIPYYIMQTEDGGYLACGMTIQNSATIPVYVVKTNSAGNIQWQKTYNTSPEFSRSMVSNAIALADGSYLLAGINTHNGLFTDIMLLKINSNGTVQWAKAYGGSDAEYGGKVIKDIYDNYIVCGETASSNSLGYYDGLVMQVDSSGNLLQSSVFGQVNGDDEFASVVQLNDGGYMFGGTTSSYDSYGYSDYMLMRVDKNFKGPGCAALTSNILETNFLLTDTTDVTKTDVVVTGGNVTGFPGSGADDSLICDVSTGVVFPPSINSGLAIYPNPSSGKCMIEVHTQTAGNLPVTIGVINDQGQIVYSIEENISGGELEKELLLPASLAPGIYLVRITGLNKSYSAKLVLQR